MSVQPIRKLPAALVAAALVVLLFAAPAMAAPPEASTGAATNVTQSKATLSGTISTGGAETLYGFEYGVAKESKEGTEGQLIAKGVKTPVAVSQSVSGLKAGTTYYYRAVAFANGTPAFGEYRTFTTLAPHIPSFQAGRYPARVSGGLASGTNVEFKFTTTGKCGQAELSSNLPSASAKLPVGAQLGNCTLSIGGTTSVTMNSCHFVFDVDNAGPPYAGHVSVTCVNAGDRIEIVNPQCTVKLLPGSVHGEVSYANQGEEGSRSAAASFMAEGVEVAQKTGSLCFLVREKGSIEGTFALEASDGQGQTDLFLGGEEVAQSGVFVTGTASEEPASQPRFAAEQYPQELLAEQDPEDKVNLLKTGTTSVTCDVLGLSGNLAGATNGLALSASFDDCTLLGSAATVTMNGCKLILGVANVGPPYVGSPGISCSGGNAIGVVSSGCTITIPSQTASGGASYTNAGSGSDRSVDVDVSAAGISYLKSGPLCFLVGNGSDGAMGFGFKLYGLK